MHLPEPLVRLIDELAKLPGIGKKSAQRLAFHLLRAPRPDAEALARAVADLKDKIGFCSVCFGVTDQDPCAVCRDAGRDGTAICVVEEPFNVYTIERTGGFRGVYHVLLGSLSPIKGVGPEDLKIRELVERVAGGQVREVILALNPDVEGEATSIHLSRILRPLGVRVTRIALGLPVGSDLDYVDDVTMTRSLEGRREI